VVVNAGYAKDIRALKLLRDIEAVKLLLFILSW
jgi:hypothetical protein